MHTHPPSTFQELADVFSDIHFMRPLGYVMAPLVVPLAVVSMVARWVRGS